MLVGDCFLTKPILTRRICHIPAVSKPSLGLPLTVPLFERGHLVKLLLALSCPFAPETATNFNSPHITQAMLAVILRG